MDYDPNLLSLATGSQSKTSTIVDKISSYTGVEIEATFTKQKVSLVVVVVIVVVDLFLEDVVMTELQLPF